jgi:hypothetical protein
MVHKWKIVIIEYVVFLVLSSLHNYKVFRELDEDIMVQKWKIVLVESHFSFE